LIASSLCALLLGCTVAIGAGVAVAVVGAGALGADCSDAISVRVIDGSTGNKICDATVTAAQDGDESDILPCYHARLGRGTWQLRAEKPGYREAMTTLSVVRDDECVRSVQSVELTLLPLSAVPGVPLAQPAVMPPAASASPAPVAPPAPAPTSTEPAQRFPDAPQR
jgi:hypothetical protein